MQISIIAAIASNGVIGVGNENKLPWHLPLDLKNFRKLTLGKPIIMGRKTYISIGRTLPDRRNIVVSRGVFNTSNLPIQTMFPNCEVYRSLTQALAAVQNTPEVMAVGGATIYEQTLPLAHKMYLTMIHHSIAGDIYFPRWHEEEWDLLERLDFAADNEHLYDYSFLTLQHRK